MQAHEAPADEDFSQTSSQESADSEDETEEDEEEDGDGDADAAVDHDNVSNFLGISISATYDTSHELRQEWDIFSLGCFISLFVTE
jgi:hypothetical protein